MSSEAAPPPTSTPPPSTATATATAMDTAADIGDDGVGAARSQELPSAPRIERQQTEALYDRFSLELSSMRVLIAPADVRWQSDAARHDPKLHLLNQFGLQLELKMVSSETLPEARHGPIPPLPRPPPSTLTPTLTPVFAVYPTRGLTWTRRLYYQRRALRQEPAGHPSAAEHRPDAHPATNLSESHVT